jgi:DNA-binding CsgD family transcriptional regulator
MARMTIGGPGVRRAGALLERDRELAVLHGLVESAAAGDATLAIVEGRAGIGKSRLIGAGREHAADGGFRVLTARGTDLEREFPYGVVRQLFEPLRASDPGGWERWLGGSAAPARSVFDDPGAGSEDGLRDASFSNLHGLYWLTVNLAADQPLALVIDDLHWCDRPSLRFLAYLAPRLEGLPVLALAGLRSSDPGTDPALLADLASAPSTVLIDPGPLSRESVGRLIADRLGTDPDDDFVGACFDSTGGNPLLLGQLISSLDAEGVRPEAGNVEIVRTIGPRAVSRTVLLRLSRLSAAAIPTAHALAVLGEDAELPVVAGLAELDESTAAAATAELARADILRPDPPLGFAHPLVLEAVYRDIAPGERELRHARAAQLLVERGARADQVASHLLVAPCRGERWVAEALRTAGKEALRRGASDSAMAYLHRAVEEPAPDDIRAELLYELGLAEESTNGPAALEHLQTAHAGMADPRQRAEVAFRIAVTQLFTGSPDEAALTAQRALDDLPDDMQDDRYRFQAFQVGLFYFGVGDPALLDDLVPYRTQPPTGGPGAKMLTLLTALAWAYANGPADAVQRLVLDAIGDGTLFHMDGSMSPGIAGGTLTIAEYPDMEAFWEERLADAHRRGSLFATLTAHLWRAWSQVQAGDLADSARSMEAAREGQRLWGLGVAAGSAQTAGILTGILTQQGRIAEARQALESAAPDQVTTYGMVMWRRARTGVLLGERRYEEAVASADEMYVPWADNPVVNPWRTMKAQALDALGRTDEGIELATQELTLARESGSRGAIGHALRIRGTLRRDDGLPDLREAVEVLERTNARISRARAFYALGAALRRSRQPTEAREPLRRALDVATACGATGLVEDVRSELAAAGARPRSTALGGVESLTVSERRVAGLAAEGLTNRDIAQSLYVTPKTVEVHLSNAYRKLGIKSRRELAAALADGTAAPAS